MSRALETYLVKLYLDRDARHAFLADPRGAAVRAGLDDADVASLERVDREGLEMAARSFEAKRATLVPRGLWARLRAWWRRPRR